jgi:hypothetical protein
MKPASIEIVLLVLSTAPMCEMPGVVRQDGNWAFFRNFFKLCDHLLLIGHVAAMAAGSPSCSCDLLTGSFRIFRAEIKNMDFGA